MNYSGVLNDLNNYYDFKETIGIMNKSVGLNGSNLLILLYVKEGRDTFFKLVNTLSIDRSLISRAIIGMEKSRIIERKIMKKSKKITLTIKGEKLLEEALKIYEC